MELAKNSKNREFSDRQQSHKNLTGDVTYYRIHLNSEHKRAGTTVSEAVFDVGGVFPATGRQDLLDGEWEVFMEDWIAQFLSASEGNIPEDEYYPRMSLKFCLPDLMLSPQDFTTTGVGKAVRDDTVSHVPIDFAFVSYSQPVEVPPAFQDTIFSPVTSVDSTTDLITVESTDGFEPGTPVYFSSSLSNSDSLAGVDIHTNWVVKTVHSGTQFQIAPSFLQPL